MFIKHSQKPIEVPKLREARIPHMYDSIRVVVGSDEVIFDETYVTAIIGADRFVKFKKAAVQYK